MYKHILDNFAMHIELSDEEKAIAISLLQSQTIKKNRSLIAAGNVCRNIYFVDKGCLRLFSFDSENLEHNVLLCPENWWAADTASFSTRTSAFYSISALEDSELFFYPYQDLEKLYILVPKFERFFRIMFQNGFSLYQNRITSNATKTAQERYVAFRKLYPALEQRISQKHIASYLGITPVFLSRIRKREFGKKHESTTNKSSEHA